VFVLVVPVFHEARGEYIVHLDQPVILSPLTSAARLRSSRKSGYCG